MEEEVVLAVEVAMEEEEVGVVVLVEEEEEEEVAVVKVEEKEIGSVPTNNVETITFHGEITAIDVMPLDQEVVEEMMTVSVGDGEE